MTYNGAAFASKRRLRFFSFPGGDALPGQTIGPRASLAEQIDQVEKHLIEDALRRCDGQVTRTAEWLGTPRKTLYDKLQRHGIVPEDFRS